MLVTKQSLYNLDHAHADVIEFISADHQRAMATEDDDVDDRSRLTKNSKAAPDCIDLKDNNNMGSCYYDLVFNYCTK